MSAGQRAESEAGIRDPYGDLAAHIINCKALYCEDGCGSVAPSGYGDDADAAGELEAMGWAVRPHSLGGLTALCPDCVKRYDARVPTPEEFDRTRVTPPASPDAIGGSAR